MKTPLDLRKVASCVVVDGAGGIHAVGTAPLARALGVSPGHVSRVLRGERKSKRLSARIAEVMRQCRDSDAGATSSGT